MAQTGSSSSRKSGGSASSNSRSGGRKTASSKKSSASAGGRSSSSRSAATSRSTKASAAKRRAAAKKGGEARGRQQRARKRASQTATRATQPAQQAARASGSDSAGKGVAEFREALAAGIVQPTNLVILSRDRIEEVMNDAVKRGRVTVDDAQKLADSLIRRARRETSDVVRDLEQLVGRGRDRVDQGTDTARRRGESAAERARRDLGGATAKVRSRAAKSAAPALAPVDRARRAVGVGPSFPITGYEDLTAAEVQGRLGDLTPAELRKVRDHEPRNANRKSVLNTINPKLG